MTKDDFIAAVRECADLLGGSVVKQFAGGPVTGMPEEARQPFLNQLRAKVHEEGWSKTHDGLWFKHHLQKDIYVLAYAPGKRRFYGARAWEKRDSVAQKTPITFMHASGDPHTAMQAFIRRATNAGCEVRDTGRYLEYRGPDGILRRCAKPIDADQSSGISSYVEYTDENGCRRRRLKSPPPAELPPQPPTFQDAMDKAVEAVRQFAKTLGGALTPELIKQLTGGAITDDKLAPVWQRGKPGITPEVLAHSPDDTNAGFSHAMYHSGKYLTMHFDEHQSIELENMVLPPPKAAEKAEPAPRLHPLQRVAPLSPAPYAMTCWRNCDEA